MKRAFPTFIVTIAFALLVASCTPDRTDEVAANESPSISTAAEPQEDDRSTGDIDRDPDGPACAITAPTAIGDSNLPLRFYADCGGAGDAPYPIYRDGGRFDLSGALQLMANGLTEAERDAGLFSWFDSQDGITIYSEIDDEGVLTLRYEHDGQPWWPAASTSSETLSFVDPLAATVFTFAEVEAIDRSGLCIGELDCEGVLQRGEFEQLQFINNGVVTSRPCGVGDYWSRPESCSVSGIAEMGPLLDATVIGVADDDTLNMRAGPSADAFIVANHLQTGSTVRATEIFREADDGGLWRLIYDDAGVAGWVNSAFLSRDRNGFEVIAESFVAFAKNPSPDSLSELSFTEDVQLGLGPQLLASEAAADLADPDVWVMDAEYFRAYVGPFSIIEPLRRVTHWDVEIGSHAHCAGDPMPVPAELETATIVSIQPVDATIDSCLQWFAVDLFVDAQGRIEGVTFDTWEP